MGPRATQEGRLGSTVMRGNQYYEGAIDARDASDGGQYGENPGEDVEAQGGLLVLWQ